MLRRLKLSRHRKLRFEPLEDRRVLAAAFAEFLDPNPAPGNRFGDTIVALSTGNVAITSPLDDAGGEDAGAVYLFSGATGRLLSTLRGSRPGDQIGSGGVNALTNGNFVVISPLWDNGEVADAGAATFASGMVGLSGSVNIANSLVGSSPSDQVGSTTVGNGVVALTNGNYVVRTPLWNRDDVADVGAATLGSGLSGIVGVISESNSLVGNHSNDQISSGDVEPLANGNYVVASPNWYNGIWGGAGAATFGNGTTGITGVATRENSLTGDEPGDGVGFSVRSLPNGNYLVVSSRWHTYRGAVTFGNGGSGIIGIVSAENSLVGGTQIFLAVSGGLDILPNSNYVVLSQFYPGGSATFGSGTAGVNGVVSPANSLVGNPDDSERSLGVQALTNGNYVVRAPDWDNGSDENVGAVVFVNGETGLSGFITANMALVGSTAGDRVGSQGVTPLANGNYVVLSPLWDSPTAVNAGAATFGNGETGIRGVVNAANSLVGTKENDHVAGAPAGSLGGGAYALSNGNYVVVSPYWNDGDIVDVGAATLGNGATGTVGEVTLTNSLVGSNPNDLIGRGQVVALAGGNYVVASPFWDDGTVADVGAATLGNGITGVVGRVSAANSLNGGSANDQVARVGGLNVVALDSGSYVVSTVNWDSANSMDAGAVTFGDLAGGVQGVVSDDNSLVGSTTGDMTGRSYFRLSNGNGLFIFPNWDNQLLANAGAVAFVDGKTGVRGPIDASNSLIGGAVGAGLDSRRVSIDDVNQNYYAAFPADGGGRVRVGSQIDGLSRRWHNASRANDVNNDLRVTARDALDIINYVNAGFSVNVSADASQGSPFGFLDATGDNRVTAGDALEIINVINAGLNLDSNRSEGEFNRVFDSDVSAIDLIHTTSHAMSDMQLLHDLLISEDSVANCVQSSAAHDE